MFIPFRFSFPSVFIIYGTVSLSSVMILLSVSLNYQKELFCSSSNLFESIDNPTMYCTATGRCFLYKCVNACCSLHCGFSHHFCARILIIANHYSAALLICPLISGSKISKHAQAISLYQPTKHLCVMDVPISSIISIDVILGVLSHSYNNNNIIEYLA